MDYSTQKKIRNVLSNLSFKKLAEKDFNLASSYYLTNCADKIYVKINVENNKIVDVSWNGDGCSIAYLSAELIARLIYQKDLNDAKKWLEDLKNFALNKKENLAKGEIFDLFQFLKDHPIRKRCLLVATSSYLIELNKF
ncbi:/ / SUF system FeS assembly protein, NifU family / 160870:161283 Forward [Candidatus Hepatoplasma crinochetorum]|uniref:/ / SUF system FeS assembly protein, NifU family / 160870:161283 Forward n=1 Tax=Candidatus Hepatoplasma crinochetorum TaxID=295596 RepID=A0A0G7ZM79_9MOLU|nr:/ / SUF system FeS assembly protein, NifU family / 160870:161283 Forward [Candidatus Hepatoplasma crinochetorum]